MYVCLRVRVHEYTEEVYTYERSHTPRIPQSDLKVQAIWILQGLGKVLVNILSASSRLVLARHPIF